MNSIEGTSAPEPTVSDTNNDELPNWLKKIRQGADEITPNPSRRIKEYVDQIHTSPASRLIKVDPNFLDSVTSDAIIAELANRRKKDVDDFTPLDLATGKTRGQPVIEIDCTDLFPFDQFSDWKLTDRQLNPIHFHAETRKLGVLYQMVKAVVDLSEKNLFPRPKIKSSKAAQLFLTTFRETKNLSDLPEQRKILMLIHQYAAEMRFTGFTFCLTNFNKLEDVSQPYVLDAAACRISGKVNSLVFYDSPTINAVAKDGVGARFDEKRVSFDDLTQ